MPSNQQGQFGQETSHLPHHAIRPVARTVGHTAKQPDRAMRFFARLDRHLLTLADQAARRAFLDRQLEGWCAMLVSSPPKANPSPSSFRPIPHRLPISY